MLVLVAVYLVGWLCDSCLSNPATPLYVALVHDTNYTQGGAFDLFQALQTRNLWC